MAQERQWDAVPPQALTADGTALGVVTVADTSGFYVKGYAYLVNPIAGARQLQVQYVTPTTIVLGPMGSTPSVNNYVDVSAYTVALGSTVFFPQQSKNKIKSDDQDSATYAGDPIVARRVIPVDSHGDFYDSQNPIPVDVIPNTTQTLGALGMPDYISELLDSLEYDGVTSTTVGNTETLAFSLQGTQLFVITITRTANGWTIGSAGLFGYILQENGDHISLETGVGSILEEG